MTSKYNPFYRTKPKNIYIPNHWGQLDQGEWVEDDNFSPPPKRESEEYLDARNLFRITNSIGDGGTNERTDVGKLEAMMHVAGVYDLDDTGGPTGYYGARLKEAVKKFQKAHALRVDGDVNPDGETIRTIAQNLQDMGRRGDKVLAHLTPEEARLLHENTDGGSINPLAGLMEFFDDGDEERSNIWPTQGDSDREGSHIWPTAGDGEAIRDLAQRLQNMGRRGDKVLAHLTPEEARFLHENTDGGSINPLTGLMEFFDDGNDDKKGTYIWSTEGDGKVRPSHAERDGKEFSWDDPPEGGHPGEAENCRCTAEEPEKPEKDPEKEKRCQELTGSIKNKENQLNTVSKQLAKSEKNFQKAEDDFDQAEQEFEEEKAILIASLSADIGSAVISGGVPGLILAATKAGLDLYDFKEKLTAMNTAEIVLNRAQNDLVDDQEQVEKIEDELDSLRSEKEKVCGK